MATPPPQDKPDPGQHPQPSPGRNDPHRPEPVRPIQPGGQDGQDGQEGEQLPEPMRSTPD